MRRIRRKVPHQHVPEADGDRLQVEPGGAARRGHGAVRRRDPQGHGDAAVGGETRGEGGVELRVRPGGDDAVGLRGDDGGGRVSGRRGRRVVDLPDGEDGLALGRGVADARGAGARGEDEDGRGRGEGEFGVFGEDREGGVAELDGAGAAEGLLGEGGGGVQVEGVVLAGVGDEGAPGGFVHVGAHGGPAVGVFDGLELFGARPVPDFEGVAEAGGDGHEGRGLGEDGVAADKVFAGAGLGGGVARDFDGGEDGAAADGPDFDELVAVLAGEGGGGRGDVEEVDGWVLDALFGFGGEHLPRADVEGVAGSFCEGWSRRDEVFDGPLREDTPRVFGKLVESRRVG